MKIRRALLVAAGGTLLLGGIAVACAFTPAFQTWQGRRFLAANPGLGGSVERVRVRPGHIQVEGLRLSAGGRTLVVPAADIEAPVIAAMRGDLRSARISAKGWSLDLGAPPGPAVGMLQAAAASLQALFHDVRLPGDLSVDSLALEGDVLIPASGGAKPTRMNVAISGGDLAVGRVSAFSVRASATLEANTQVSSLDASGSVEIAMDSPRTFSRGAVRFEVEATGARFPKGTKLRVEAGAGRADTGDSYSILIEGERQRLLDVQGRYLVDVVKPGNPPRLGGTWKTDIRDADLAPFSLGFPIPNFVLKGEGSFQAATDSDGFGLSGHFETTADRLGVVLPQLAGFGPVSAAASFDVSRRGRVLDVAELSLELGAARPVASIQVLQPFSIDVNSWLPRATDPSRDLLGIMLRGLPAGWVEAFGPGVTIRSGDMTGSFLFGYSPGGAAVVRSSTPFSIPRLTLVNGIVPVIDNLDLSGRVFAEYSVDGWQAELTGLEARSGGEKVLEIDGRAGRLAGAGQSTKITGRFAAELPALLRQPAAAGRAVLAAGHAGGTFSASLGQLRSFQAKLALAGLAAAGPTGPGPLPSFSADLRVDVAQDGRIALKFPLSFEDAGRKSDVVLDGGVSPIPGGFSVSGQVTSEFMTLEESTALLGILRVPVGELNPTGPVNGPPWSGLKADVALSIKRLAYGTGLEATGVTGRVRIDESSIQYDKIRASLGSGSEFSLSGGIAFDATKSQPFSMKASMGIEDFDAGRIFAALLPNRPAPIEGRFNMTSEFVATGESPAGLAEAARGEFHLTSRSGVFRLLKVDLSDKVEARQSTTARVGEFLGELTGRERFVDYWNLPQIVTGISRTLAEIPFHQLSFTLVPASDTSVSVHDLTLISPEVRLRGAGRVGRFSTLRLSSQPIELRLQLGARGALADLMRRGGLLNGAEDNLGYSSFTVPLTVGGSLEMADNATLKDVLVKAADASINEFMNRKR